MEEIPSPKQHRRPLPSLLSVSSSMSGNPWDGRKPYRVITPVGEVQHAGDLQRGGEGPAGLHQRQEEGRAQDQATPQERILRSVHRSHLIIFPSRKQVRFLQKIPLYR